MRCNKFITTHQNLSSDVLCHWSYLFDDFLAGIVDSSHSNLSNSSNRDHELKGVNLGCLRGLGWCIVIAVAIVRLALLVVALLLLLKILLLVEELRCSMVGCVLSSLDHWLL